MVLQRNRGAEQSHDAVARELVDGVAVVLDDSPATVEQLRHHLAQPFRIEPRRKVHRSDDVGEQDGDLLVFGLRCVLRDR
jgi:hypothetical protein